MFKVRHLPCGTVADTQTTGSFVLDGDTFKNHSTVFHHYILPRTAKPIRIYHLFNRRGRDSRLLHYHSACLLVRIVAGTILNIVVHVVRSGICSSNTSSRSHYIPGDVSINVIVGCCSGITVHSTVSNGNAGTAVQCYDGTNGVLLGRFRCFRQIPLDRPTRNTVRPSNTPPYIRVQMHWTTHYLTDGSFGVALQNRLVNTSDDTRVQVTYTDYFNITGTVVGFITFIVEGEPILRTPSRNPLNRVVNAPPMVPVIVRGTTEHLTRGTDRYCANDRVRRTCTRAHV